MVKSVETGLLSDKEAIEVLCSAITKQGLPPSEETISLRGEDVCLYFLYGVESFLTGRLYCNFYFLSNGNFLLETYGFEGLEKVHELCLVPVDRISEIPINNGHPSMIFQKASDYLPLLRNSLNGLAQLSGIRG